MAQHRPKRIGYLGRNEPSWFAAFHRGMSGHGRTNGRDYVLDMRFSDNADVGQMAAELVATAPDLLLAVADNGTGSLLQNTRTIPIVFAAAQDPVGFGLAKSLRRPGGNATGLSMPQIEIAAKRLQLIKEAFPRVTHVAILLEPADIRSRSMADQLAKEAARLGMRLSVLEIGRIADIEPAFKRGVALGVQAYASTPGPVIANERNAIAQAVQRSGAPAIFGSANYADAGGLITYGYNGDEHFRRAAAYVDKILKGAKPGDLPIELPTKFELIVNMRTAKAMGLAIPKSLLLRADRVIE